MTEEQKVVNCMFKANAPLMPKAIARATKLPGPNVRRILHLLRAAGKTTRTKAGHALRKTMARRGK